MTTNSSASNRKLILGLLFGFLLGVAACWSYGLFSTRYHPIEESKLCYLALREHSDELQPQTREYLKARLYWNADVWVAKSWMSGWQLYFGPVDDSVLGGLKAIKDTTSTAEVYRDVLIKYGITPKPNQ